MTIHDPISAVDTSATEINETKETKETAETKETEEIKETKDDTELVQEDAQPTVEDLNHLLVKAAEQSKTHWDNLLRKQAECDNLQKRMTRDVEHARKYALEKFATEMLAVKDSMELGLQALSDTDNDVVRDGMTLTLKMLSDSLTKFGIMEINPIDEKFNPQWHEAMAMQPSEKLENGMILHIHQKGYQLNDRLLRPARVVVVKNADPEQTLENQV